MSTISVFLLEIGPKMDLKKRKSLPIYAKRSQSDAIWVRSRVRSKIAERTGWSLESIEKQCLHNF